MASLTTYYANNSCVANKRRYSTLLRLCRILLLLAGVATTAYFMVQSQGDFKDIDERDVKPNKTQWHWQQTFPHRYPLELKDNKFYNQGVPFRILSGSIHYFRVVPDYWRDRLMKLKAAGLNTVDTYVPWNVHEEQKGVYTFAGWLDLRKFVLLAHELDLYVIIRPGPYICGEWDFGGLPSWLLRDPKMKVRTTYKPFTNATLKFWEVMLYQVMDLHNTHGGPIIAYQVENEYGSYGADKAYMTTLKTGLEERGVRELIYTSDNQQGLKMGGLPDVLATVNFKKTETGTELFNQLKTMQPSKPTMVSEFWTGWFDQYFKPHTPASEEDFSQTLEFILESGASVNLYMFHGGTTFGFMNGANAPEVSQVTSYDYDAPVTEAGDITPKFTATRKLMSKYMNPGQVLPEVPPNMPKASYGEVQIKDMIYFEGLLKYVDPIKSELITPMEMLNINKGSGQAFGFTLYRHDKANRARMLKFSGSVHDRAIIMINRKFVTIVDYHLWSPTIPLDSLNVSDLKDVNVLDIFVENLGRVNFGGTLNYQRKGLDQPVHMDQKELRNWLIYPFEFRPSFVDRASKEGNWQKMSTHPGVPCLYRAELVIADQPKDTFIDVEGWSKGIIFINGFNIGRYWKVGPQKTLYIPAPLLRMGFNEIMIFELHKPSETIKFVQEPAWI